MWRRLAEEPNHKKREMSRRQGSEQPGLLWGDEELNGESTTETGLWGVKTNRIKDRATQPCQGPDSCFRGAVVGR